MRRNITYRTATRTEESLSSLSSAEDIVPLVFFQLSKSNFMKNNYRDFLVSLWFVLSVCSWRHSPSFTALPRCCCYRPIHLYKKNLVFMFLSLRFNKNGDHKSNERSVSGANKFSRLLSFLCAGDLKSRQKTQFIIRRNFSLKNYY